MDEPVFDGRSQHTMPGAEGYSMIQLRGMSGDMSRKRQDGTWETLATYAQNRSERKDSSYYKATKWKRGSRVADETVVLRMRMQHNILGGKGLYYKCVSEEGKERVLF